MGILGLLGGLLGGGGGVKTSRAERSRENRVTPASQVSQSSADPNTVKAKAAGKLALIKTGSAGVLNDTASGRKKLLGN